MDDAESLLFRAEAALSSGDYKTSFELAEQAETIALDMDEDGVPNDVDFAPSIDNYYIYIGIVIFLVGSVITFKIGSKKLKKSKLNRQRVKEAERRMERIENRIEERMRQEILDMIEEVGYD